MSDYEDVLYDPRIHTHTSCVDEVRNCDILVLIIGSRFGGKVSSEALNKVNFEALKNESNSVDSLKEKECLSVTQLEVLKAIENSMPVYTFIEKQVWHDHALYEKNKASGIVEQIIFPSIEKQETAKYIFNFINFVRLRTKGNNIFTFEKGQDIEEILKKQWSGYFQRLLNEQRLHDNEQKRIDALSEQFEDLKTAILTSIEDVDQRETARGVVRYRRLVEVLSGLRISPKAMASSNDTFRAFLEQNGIAHIVDAREVGVFSYRNNPARSFLIMHDGKFFESRISAGMIYELENDWDSFKKLKTRTKEIILDALQDMVRPTVMIRYRDEHFEDYIQKCGSEILTKDDMK